MFLLVLMTLISLGIGKELHEKHTTEKHIPLLVDDAYDEKFEDMVADSSESQAKWYDIKLQDELDEEGNELEEEGNELEEDDREEDDDYDDITEVSESNEDVSLRRNRRYILDEDQSEAFNQSEEDGVNDDEETEVDNYDEDDDNIGTRNSKQMQNEDDDTTKDDEYIYDAVPESRRKRRTAGTFSHRSNNPWNSQHIHGRYGLHPIFYDLLKTTNYYDDYDYHADDVEDHGDNDNEIMDIELERQDNIGGIDVQPINSLNLNEAGKDAIAEHNVNRQTSDEIDPKNCRMFLRRRSRNYRRKCLQLIRAANRLNTQDHKVFDEEKAKENSEMLDHQKKSRNDKVRTNDGESSIANGEGMENCRSQLQHGSRNYRIKCMERARMKNERLGKSNDIENDSNSETEAMNAVQLPNGIRPKPRPIPPPRNKPISGFKYLKPLARTVSQQSGLKHKQVVPDIDRGARVHQLPNDAFSAGYATNRKQVHDNSTSGGTTHTASYIITIVICIVAILFLKY